MTQKVVACVGIMKKKAYRISELNGEIISKSSYEVWNILHG